MVLLGSNGSKAAYMQNSLVNAAEGLVEVLLRKSLELLETQF
jgi:hypothetical protein